MNQRLLLPNRRLFLGTLGTAFFTTRGLFAEQLMLPTPGMTEGPFYPDKLPLDQDNDLIIIKDSTTPTVGTITHLTGRVLTASGSPVKDATVEIWQCDANAVYLHTRQRTEGEAAGFAFPGLWSLHDQFDRRISVPNDQAGSVSRPPGTAYSHQGEEGRSRIIDVSDHDAGI